MFGVSYMILMVLLLIWYRRAMRNSERFATVSGKGFRPRIISIGRWRYPALALFVVFGVLGFGWRSWEQRRRTGTTGFKGVRGRLGSAEWPKL